MWKGEIWKSKIQFPSQVLAWTGMMSSYNYICKPQTMIKNIICQIHCLKMFDLHLKCVFQGQITWNSHRFESYKYMFKYLNILFISVKKNCCKTNVLSSD